MQKPTNSKGGKSVGLMHASSDQKRAEDKFWSKIFLFPI